MSDASRTAEAVKAQQCKAAEARIRELETKLQEIERRGAASPAEGPTPLLTNLRFLGGRLRSELSDASMLYPKCFHLEALQQLIAEWDKVAVEAVKVEAAGPKPGPRCPTDDDFLEWSTRMAAAAMNDADYRDRDERKRVAKLIETQLREFVRLAAFFTSSAGTEVKK